MKIDVAIADSSDLMRLGMHTVLSAEFDMQVVSNVGTSKDLVRVIQTECPQVVIIDERLSPDTDILQIVEQINLLAGETRVLISGCLRDGLLIYDLFAVGCLGYLYKGDVLQEALPAAIRTVMKSRLYLSPTANAEYLTTMQSSRRDWYLDQEARQVLRLLAQGNYVGHIALTLGIDKRRVYWIRHKLRERFDANTNEHLISRAIAEGFIFPS